MIIAVANQKGGVGKTTTSVNLSAALSELGYKTLLVDIDPQGNATSGFGIQKRSVKVSSYEVLMGVSPARAAIVKASDGRTGILPANLSLAGAELELVDLPNRELKLKSALQQVREDFDYILIDCPPSLGLLTINGLNAADQVLVPIQCEYYALEGLSQLTNTIRQVKRLWNPDLELLGVLPTMFDARLNLTAQVIEEVKRFFGEKIFKSVIPRNVRLSEAPSYGKPITEYDRSSKGAESYRQLAAEVAQLTRKVGEKV